MNIVTWILWGCLLAVLTPALVLGFAIILNKVLLGKDPGETTKPLPTDGAKIKMSQLESKSDLKDLIDDSERFRINHDE